MTAGTSPLSFVTCASKTPRSGQTSSRHLVHAPTWRTRSSQSGTAQARGRAQIGIAWSEADWVVCVHQDVWLPAGWDRCVLEQLNEAERRFGPIGVAGVYGVGEVIAQRDQSQPMAAQRIGWVVDRGRILRDGPELPAPGRDAR